MDHNVVFETSREVTPPQQTCLFDMAIPEPTQTPGPITLVPCEARSFTSTSSLDQFERVPSDLAPTQTLVGHRQWHHTSDHELLTYIAGEPIHPHTLQWSQDSQKVTAESIRTLPHYALENHLGLSQEGALRVSAAMELHQRLQFAERPQTAFLRTPEQVEAYMRPYLNIDHERLWAIALDPRSQVIGEPIQLSQGDIDGTEAGARLFFREVLRVGAHAAIAVHNHPTCNLSPSAADIQVTRRLSEAGRIVGVQLMDHMILNRDRQGFSLRASNGSLFT